MLIQHYNEPIVCNAVINGCAKSSCWASNSDGIKPFNFEPFHR